MTRAEEILADCRARIQKQIEEDKKLYGRKEMEYSKQQLDTLQEHLLKCAGNKGIGSTLFFVSWVSHAIMAGYMVEEGTCKMYKQVDNVRIYYA